MMRRSWLPVALTLIGCYAPPGEPEPDKLVIEALLPTPLLDPARAACTARLLREEAVALAPRVRSGDRTDYSYRLIRPEERGPTWATADYQASYDDAQDAARAASAARAATAAAARVSAYPQSRIDFAELTMVHERAFAAAATGRERARRSAAQLARRMARSQPDLEALYRQQFDRKYRENACAAAVPVVRLARDAAVQPLLPTPLLDLVRATCVAASLSARAATEWRHVLARQVGRPTEVTLGTPTPSLSIAWDDWRQARAFAELATLHTSAFALGASPAEQHALDKAESRLRRVTRDHPDLEKLYQRAFGDDYRAGGCAAAAH